MTETRPPAAPRPRADRLQRLCGVLAVVMIAGLVLGEVGRQVWPAAGQLDRLAALAAVLLALLRIGAVRGVARAFALAAVLVAASVALWHPEALPVIERALLQGTAFSAFLTALGLIRGPVRASQVIGRAAARLFASAAHLRRAAVTFGAEFLAILFNIGTIGMLSDVAQDHARAAQPARPQGQPARQNDALDPAPITLAAQRGTMLMTVWNPIGLGFAIVTSAIPGLNPVIFLGLAFATAMLLTGLSLLAGDGARPASATDLMQAADTSAPPPPTTPTKNGTKDTSAAGGGRALLAVLCAVAGLIAVTVLLHQLLSVSFLVAACIVVPALSFLWPLLEPAARPSEGRTAFDALSEASASMASEATIFLAATVIGAGVSLVLALTGADQLVLGGALPPLVFILGCLFLVPLAGAALIPHTIVMVIAAQLLGPGPIGTAHPFSLALALCLAWAYAVSASPISAVSIITGRCLGVSPARVAFSFNRAFTLSGLAAGALIVCLVHVLE